MTKVNSRTVNYLVERRKAKFSVWNVKGWWEDVKGDTLWEANPGKVQNSWCLLEMRPRHRKEKTCLQVCRRNSWALSPTPSLNCHCLPTLSLPPYTVTASTHCHSLPTLSLLPYTVSPSLHCHSLLTLSLPPYTVTASTHCHSHPTLSIPSYTVTPSLHRHSLSTPTIADKGFCSCSVSSGETQAGRL